MGTDAVDPGVVAALYELQVQHAHFVQVLATRSDLNPADLRMLKFLGARDAPVTPKEIGVYLQMGTGAVTALLDRLERRAVVKRVRNPDDGRSILVELGVHGQPVIARLRGSYESALSAALGDYDQEALVQLLNRLAQALIEDE